MRTANSFDWLRDCLHIQVRQPLLHAATCTQHAHELAVCFAAHVHPQPSEPSMRLASAPQDTPHGSHRCSDTENDDVKSSASPQAVQVFDLASLEAFATTGEMELDDLFRSNTTNSNTSVVSALPVVSDSPNWQKVDNWQPCCFGTFNGIVAGELVLEP